MLRYHVEDGVIHLTLVGNNPVAELLEFVGTALSDPSASIPARILVDASRSAAIRSNSEVELIASTASGWKSRIDRIAFYVESELHYGLIRMGTAFSTLSAFDVKPFRTLEEALAFLEVKPPEA